MKEHNDCDTTSTSSRCDIVVVVVAVVVDNGGERGDDEESVVNPNSHQLPIRIRTRTRTTTFSAWFTESWLATDRDSKTQKHKNNRNM